MGKNDAGVSLEKELTSGEDRGWSFEESLTLAKTIKNKFKPNIKGKALYSDTNYQILGKIIEVIRQKTISEVFKEEIFNPLNLKNTYLYTDYKDTTPIHLNFKNKPLLIPKAMTSFKADGGIVSTEEESMIFLKAFFNGTFFSKEYLKEMTSVSNNIFFPLKYGIGLMRFDIPRYFTVFKKYPELLGHSGLSGAFSYYCPKLDLYFTGTVNQVASPSNSYKLLIQLLSLFN